MKNRLSGVSCVRLANLNRKSKSASAGSFCFLAAECKRFYFDGFFFFEESKSSSESEKTPERRVNKTDSSKGISKRRDRLAILSKSIVEEESSEKPLWPRSPSSARLNLPETYVMMTQLVRSVTRNESKCQNLEASGPDLFTPTQLNSLDGRLPEFKITRVEATETLYIYLSHSLTRSFARSLWHSAESAMPQKSNVLLKACAQSLEIESFARFHLGSGF